MSQHQPLKLTWVPGRVPPNSTRPQRLRSHRSSTSTAIAVVLASSPWTPAKPQELFLRASWHNRDSGIGALKKILKDPNDESGLAFDQGDFAGSGEIALAKENAKNDNLGPKEKPGILAALARAEKGLKQKAVKKKGG